MTITSLSFSFVQCISTAAMADTKAVAAAPARAPRPVAGDSCHRGGCDSPRRSPLYRALKDALIEMTQSAQPAANDTTTPSTTTAGSAATASATSTTRASATPATVTEDAAPATESAAPAAAAPDLEHAMMDFARALMQALRSGFQQGRGDDGGHEGHHHHHHHGHGHGHGRRAWGDPAQRVDALAQQVGAGTPSSAPAAPAPSSSGPAEAAAPTAAADPAPVADPATTAAASSSATLPQSTPQDTVIFVATINIQQSAAQAPPFSTLLNAFAGLQQAMGKTPAAGDPLKNELSTFLQTLAQRLRGEDAATAEATTQPGALLSVAA